MRRSAAWLVAVPLMLAGTQIAHTVAYRLVYPQAHARLLHLLATGHAYAGWIPLALGIAAACVLVSLVLTSVDAARGRASRPLPAWAFGALPPLAFAVQELLELSLHTGTFAWQAVLAPTFLPGLLLQLPVGVLAYLAARLLLRAAARIGRAFARPVPRELPHVAAPAAPIALRTRLAAASRLARGPPRVVLA
jgi:hypothetical protein